MIAPGKGFSGFPSGARATPVPNVLFSDVLPEVDDPAELLVTLYAFFLIGRKPSGARRLTPEELRADRGLARALTRVTGSAGTLDRGLDAAVARGTLLRHRHGGHEVYTVNSPAAARALGVDAGPAGPPPLPPAVADPPSIYALYEDTIGTISPLIAEELRAAEESYPPGWISEAFREAASLNRRSWRYVQRILERWRDEGRQDASFGRDPEGRRDMAGRYGHVVRR